MKKSINAWSVSGDTSFETMFAQLNEAGFDGVELNLDKEGRSAHSLTMQTDEKELKKIKQLSEKYSLPIVSISTSLYAGKMGSPIASDQECSASILKRQLELAAHLGADGILAVPGAKLLDGVSLLQAYENSFQVLEKLKPIINDYKIKVGLENVWNGFFQSPFDMANFIDRLACDYIGAYFDVGNVIAFSVSEYWIEILGNRICKVHIKDFKRNGGFNSGGKTIDLTKGDVNWDKVVPALKKAGFDAYLTAEVSPTMEYDNITTFYKEVAEQTEKIIGGIK